jgi:hypothetical protein
MKSFLIMVAAIAALAGCVQPYDGDVVFPTFDDPQEIQQWVYRNITYVSDTIHGRRDEWQTPEQTLVWRTGDCDDKAILALEIAHRSGFETSLMLGYDHKAYSGTTGHAWVKIDGTEHDPTAPSHSQGLMNHDSYRLVEEWSYERAIRAATYFRSVTAGGPT